MKGSKQGVMMNVVIFTAVCVKQDGKWKISKINAKGDFSDASLQGAMIENGALFEILAKI